MVWVTWALTAESDPQARFMAGAVAILAYYQRTVGPVGALRVAGTLIAQTTSGGLLVPAPVDYAAWTERVASFAARPDLAARDREIWLTGRLSPRARQELTRLQWATREGVGAGVVRPGGPEALEDKPSNPAP